VLITDIGEKNNLTIKLSDFGLSTRIDEGKTEVREKMGSLCYMAPEVLRREAYDERVDIWSTCVVLYVLITGEQPFYNKIEKQTQKNIKEKELIFNSKKWSRISNNAKDFIKLGLTKDQNKRPNCKAMMEHDWLWGKAKKDYIQKIPIE